MTKIAVFDSGLGSLSIIKPIQKIMKSNIVYFADTKNFPYGKKSIKELQDLTRQTILFLQNSFMPDLIVVGSNTLSLTLDSHPKNVMTVLPPLNEAKRITKSNSIAILATESIAKSKLLDEYITRCKINNVNILKINASPLVELVEYDKIYFNPELCKNIIKKTLSLPFLKNNVDVATLSSTHLPFLSNFFKNLFPNVRFLDPGESIASKVKKRYSDNSVKKNSVQIFTTGNVKSFEIKLNHLKIYNKISKLVMR